MSTVIQIKRSANVTAPTTVDLLEGELAYSYDKSNSGVGAKLYIEALDAGNNEVIHAIGGKYYTDTVDAATSSNTASTIVKRDASGDIAVRDITARNITGNITGTIQGQAASAVIANTANALTTGRVINLSGDLEGNVTFNGSSDVTIVANVKPNSVALGTDTSGDYLSNVLAGTGIVVTGQGGETATPTVALGTSGVVAATYGGATQIPVIVFDAYGRATSASNVSLSTSITLGADSGTADALANGDTLRILGGTGVDTAVTDNTITVALETTGVSANTYGGASKIPVFTVDATGRITSAANVSVAGVSSFVASGNTFTISTADGGSFSASIQQNSIELGRDTTGDYVKNVLSSTGIVVSGAAGETRDVTIALENTAVTPGTYGGASAIPTFVVDQQGRLTSAGNVSVSTSFALSDGTNTDTFNNGDVFRILAGTGVSSTLTDNTFTIANTGVTGLSSGGYGISVSGATGSISVTNTGVTRAIAGTGISLDANNGNVTITNNGVTSITGTANEVDVSSSTGSITIGLPNNVTIANDLSVSGNLYVTGNVVALPVENLVIEDSLIQLANNNISTDIIDIGFYGSYNVGGGTHEHTGLFRDASDGVFKLFQGLQGQDNLTSTVNISGTGYTLATLNADLLASNANVYTALTFGGDQHKILPLNASVLEIRGGLGDSNGALSLAAGNYPTSYSKIYLESGKKITAQADEFYVTLFNDGSTKLITMNTTHTVATSNTNGALRVAGGAGFTGAVYAASFHGYIDGGSY